MLAMALALATTAGGYLLVLAVIVPVIGMLLSLVIGGRHAERIALALMPAGLGLSLAIAVEVWVTGQPLVYVVGGLDAAARHRARAPTASPPSCWSPRRW